MSCQVWRQNTTATSAALGTGAHVVTLDPERALPARRYFLRLMRGPDALRARAAEVR